MLRFIINNSIRAFLLTISTGYFVYLLIQPESVSIVRSLINYIHWFTGFVKGSYGFTADGLKEIVFMSGSEADHQLGIGWMYLHSIGTSVVALVSAFLMALLLNSLITIQKLTSLRIVQLIAEWLSTIHILIIGIIISQLYFTGITYWMGVAIIAIGSNAYFDLSELQRVSLSELVKRDYIIAAKAWGDRVFKHMRRGLLINSINQLASLWVVFLTNTLIYEMIFQKPGLGYLIWKHFLEVDSGTLVNESGIAFETNQILAVSMLIVCTLIFMNYLRSLLLHYLLVYRR